MSAVRTQPHQKQQLSLALDFDDTLPPQTFDVPIDQGPVLCEIEAAEAHAKKRRRQSLGDVLTKVAVIEVILQGGFAGKGRGINSKLDSSRYKIPSDLDKRLRYIDAVRNMAIYEPAYEIPNREQFLIMCEQAATELVLLARKGRMQMPAVGSVWTRLAGSFECLWQGSRLGRPNALAR